METSALNASNVEQAFLTIVNGIFYKKMPKSVDNASAPISAPTVPVSSEAQVVIAPNQKSFRLKDNQKPADTNKSKCCINS